MLPYARALAEVLSYECLAKNLPLHSKACSSLQVSLARRNNVKACSTLSSLLLALIRSDDVVSLMADKTLTGLCLLHAAIPLHMQNLPFHINLPIAAPPKVCNLHT